MSLECNIQTEIEFMVTTLEMFGLPKKYMSGGGHHLDWKTKADGDSKNKKKAAAKKKKQKLNKLQQLRLAKGIGVEEAAVKPTHFDLEPLRDALKKFMVCSAENRSQVRSQFYVNHHKVKEIFLDEHKETSFKKILDVHEIAQKLADCGFLFDPDVQASLGSLLLCFGDIEHERTWGDRIPPETPE